MSNIIVGSSRKLRCTFDIDGTNTDPTTITLVVMDPQKNSNSYTYAGGDVTREAQGIFSRNHPFPLEGRWRWRWVGTGNCVAADEGVILVNTSPFQ
jgi:hypothetical protein